MRCTAALCLAVFIFSFLHSELGQFASEGDTHETHDFCMLVVDTTSQMSVWRAQWVIQSLGLNDPCAQSVTMPAAASAAEFPRHCCAMHQAAGCTPAGVDLYLSNSVFLL